MNLPPEDSLDNLSALQTSKYRQLQAQIKHHFTAALQKLQSSETREIGISQLRKLVENHRQPEHLRNFIAILKTLKPSTNSPSREHEILVISILASIFKQELLDPIDKPPSLTKTCFRLVQILHNYFFDLTPTVQQACARALLDLTNYCLKSQNTNTIFQIIYSPLLSILKSGVDKGSQSTAAACLNELINYSKRENKHEIIEKLSPEILAVILKINCEYFELFHVVYSMIQTLGLAFLDYKVVSFLAKILGVINGTRDSSNNSNLNSYMCKVNVCKIIEKVGYLMPLKQKQKLVDLNIVESLQQAARHRIMQVQLAASTALKAWRGQLEQSPRSKGLNSLQAKRNNKKLQRSQSKEERQRLENELTYMKEDLEKLVKGGWGANNRAKNYIKRGSGIGGGYHGKMDGSPNSKSNGKSHKQHFQELRQYIKKGAVQNKKIDRFANAEVKQKSHSPQKISPKSSPPPRKRSKGQNSNDQIKLEVDEGDQALPNYKEIGYQQDQGDNLSPTPAINKPTSKSNKKAKQNDIYKSIGMNRDEIDELVANEKQLMQQGKQMKIKFYNKSSGDQKKHSRSNSRQSQSDNDSLNKAKMNKEKPQQNKEQYRIPLRQNEVKEIDRRQKKKQEKMSLKDNFFRLSQEQIGQLVEQYNLSQVSDNLNSLLNESDFAMMQSSKIPDIDADIMVTQKGKSQMESIKEIVAERKNKKSIINKFFKKEQEQKQQSPLKHAQIIQQSQKAQDNTTKPLLPQILYNHSLNFTQSLESKNQSLNNRRQREQIQFTLNPKEKFTSIKESNYQDKEIEEEIDMSQYEESVPKMQFQARQPSVPKNHIQPSEKREYLQPSYNTPNFQPSYDRPNLQPSNPVKDAKDYQKLIKNPPKLTPSITQKKNNPSQNSVYQKSETEKCPQQQEGGDVIEQWLKIISFLEVGQIDSAFQAVLILDDPIYLLRLMLITKTPLKKLSTDTIKNLWSKFIQIQGHGFIDVLLISVFGQAQELNLLSRCLPIQQMQELLLILYQTSGTSKGRLSFKAAQLYNSIENSLHSTANR